MGLKLLQFQAGDLGTPQLTSISTLRILLGSCAPWTILKSRGTHELWQYKSALKAYTLESFVPFLKWLPNI